jgi:signal transduction histidine kinase
MSLSWRLIISFAVVIFVALALAFLTLLAVARPLQNRIATARLATQSRLVARQIDNQLARDVSPQQIIRFINNHPADSNVHLLFVDTQNIIRADSKNSWAGQSFATLTDATQTGTFSPSPGDIYNFAAASVGPDNDPAGFMVAVAPRAPAIPTFFTELGWGFALAGLIALLVSLLASALIARSISQPLQIISRAATAVAQGDYSQRVPETGPPEIKRTAASFNVMAQQVEAGQQAMRDFVSNVSHELKTPLTSIQGFSQAIMEGETPDDATRRRAADIIHQEATRMGRLVEDLLDLARIDSGQVVMRKTPLDLTQLLGGAYNRLLPQAVEKKVKLEKSWGNLPPIVGDGDRLAQVFTNLLDNAVQHTPPGGTVTIAAKVTRAVQDGAATDPAAQADFVQVSVSDTGPGIPANELSRIFERFYQVDKSRKRGKGTGLGLAIIKEITEAHGGTVRAESVEDVGSKFTVTLPVPAASTKTVSSARK